MGQAKNRGTFEQRKARAIEVQRKKQMAMAEIVNRRPSPKHATLMAMMAGLMVTASCGWSRRDVQRDVEKSTGQPWAKTYKNGGRIIKCKVVPNV